MWESEELSREKEELLDSLWSAEAPQARSHVLAVRHQPKSS